MTDIPRFQGRFLHPKHAPTWLLVGLIGACGFAPRKAALRVGRVLGEFFYRRNRKRREIVDVNLELCFPELSGAERDALAREHFHFYGMNVIDLGLSWWATRRKIDRWIDFTGLEKLGDLVERGEPVILLAPHVVGMDVGGMALSSRFEMVSMMKVPPNPLLNWFLARGRTRFGGRMVMRSEGLRPLVREIRNGRACYFVPDEDFGSRASEFAPFFATERAILSVVGRMAKLTGARVLPVVCRLDPETGRYNVEIGAPLPDFPTLDLKTDAASVGKALEWCVAKAPAQYLWALRWFKTRPDGAPSPYARSR